MKKTKKLTMEGLTEAIEQLWKDRIPPEERKFIMATGRLGAIKYLEMWGYDLTENQKDLLPNGTYYISGEDTPYYISPEGEKMSIEQLLGSIDRILDAING